MSVRSVIFKRSLLEYGAFIALVLILLNILEYTYFAGYLRIELYLTVCASLFTLMGIWIAESLRVQDVHVQSVSLSFSDFNLTNREQIVLELMSEGLSNAEIAAHLSISIHTVKTHVSNIFAKMDVKRRTQAIKKAQYYRSENKKDH